MKFFKNFLVFVLILIIVGGIGYIGYTFLFMNHSGNNMPGMTSSDSDTNTAHNATDSTKDSAHNNQQSQGNSIGLIQSNLILQNKDSLDKSILSLKEAIKLMTVDPYAPNSNSNGMGNMQMQGNTQNSSTPAAPGNSQTNTTQTPIQGGNNTTINIYPENGSNSATQSNSAQQSNMSMQNMGTTYDINKMEQLHSGLYKISVGMALLYQLDNQLVNQADNANVNTDNFVQYYTNQYTLTAQNKIKLNQALTYINEAVNLININPYISSNGLVYDKDRMNLIHQSVVKFADGVVSLNQLSDNFTKQSIVFSNTVQNYINNQNSNLDTSMNMSDGLFGDLFKNISLSSVVNIILILFVLGLVFGMFGFIFSLLKPTAKKVETN